MATIPVKEIQRPNDPQIQILPPTFRYCQTLDWNPGYSSMTWHIAMDSFSPPPFIQIEDPSSCPKGINTPILPGPEAAFSSASTTSSSKAIISSPEPQSKAIFTTNTLLSINQIQSLNQNAAQGHPPRCLRHPGHRPGRSQPGH